METRGHLMYDVEGAVRLTLDRVGFNVVRRKSESHALTLFIHDNEEKGEPYGINQF